MLCTARLQAEDKVTFQQHIRPIFAANCLNCHNADRARAGLDLSSHAATIAGSSGGAIVTPGDPDGSLLFGVVAQTREPKMPRGGGKLSDADIAAIRKWIAQGCLDAADSKPMEAKKSALAAVTVPAAGEKIDPATLMPTGLPMAPAVVTPRPGAVTTLAAHWGAPLLAAGGQKQILLYDAQLGDLLGALPLGDEFPQSLRFSRSGQVLIAGVGHGARGGHVGLWAIHDGALLGRIGDEVDVVRAADLDRAQRRVALGSTSKFVKVIDVASGQQVAKLDKHTGLDHRHRLQPRWNFARDCRSQWWCPGLGSRVAERDAHTASGTMARSRALTASADSNISVTACEDGQQPAQGDERRVASESVAFPRRRCALCDSPRRPHCLRRGDHAIRIRCHARRKKPSKGSRKS